MDTIQTILTAISTVGFPIVMCGLLFWKMDKQDKEHKEEMEHMSNAINNNTLALKELCDKLMIEFDASNRKENE